MAKKSISKIAKDWNVEPAKMVTILKEAGVEVHSIHSKVEQLDVDKIQDKLQVLKEKHAKKAAAAKPKKAAVAKDGKKETKPAKKEEKSSGLKKGLKVTRKKADGAKKTAPAKVESKGEKPLEKVAIKKDPVAKSAVKPKKDPVPAKAEKRVEVKVPKANAEGNIKKPAQVTEKDLKVKVELPSDAMQARIQKYQAERQRSGGGRGSRPGQGGGRGARPGSGGQGGNRGPSVQGGNRGPGAQGGNRGPGGPGQNRPAGPAGAARPAGAAAGAVVGTPGPGGPSGYRGPGAGMPPSGAANQGRGSNAGSGRGASGPGGRSKKRDLAKKKKNEERAAGFDPSKNVSRVMASLTSPTGKKTYKKAERTEEESGEMKTIKVSDVMTVAELAGLMDVRPNMVQAKCMELGMMVTINHRIELETIQLLADEFDFSAELLDEYEEEEAFEESLNEDDMIPRPPVVTVMGHVDHGKTSLLDYVRTARVTAREAGGITQHIGAYSIETKTGFVTFLDTPGHEAFSSMRARGSQLTDVVVLVVAADDRVMPQTIESIEHAKAAKVPIVIAINKCDLPTANPDKIRAALAEVGVQVEGWGGDVSCIEISAKTGLGVDNLLETLALETEILDLKAAPDVPARGVVVESKLDKGKGALATVLVQHGVLKVGQTFVMGNYAGKVRALYYEDGSKVNEVQPGFPCQVMGLGGAPFSGDKFEVFENEAEARDVANKRQMAARDRELRTRRHKTLDQIFDEVKSGLSSEVNVIVKADVDGSAEAISTELEKLSNKEIKVNVIRKAVGNINESDIMLAAASDAIVVAFHLLPAQAVRDLANNEGVELKTYRIIYEIINEFRGVIEGQLKPTVKEEIVGEARVLKPYRINKVGMIAGCIVESGAVDTESELRIYRQGVELGLSKVSTLKRHKDEVPTVKAGFECGIGLNGFDNIKEGDTLAFFKKIEVKRTLKQVEAEEVEENKQKEIDAIKAAAASAEEAKKEEA
jgi:translation initiation factor IF-2